MMTPEIAALALSIGLVASLVCYIATNLSPGGMITPGWLAVVLVDDPLRLLIIIPLVIAIYWIMAGIERYVILYGKRQFAATVLVGVLLQVGLLLLAFEHYPYVFASETLGFIVPGLIAYQLHRQPVGATLLATGVVTMSGYVVVASGILVGLVPRLG